jgi:hypothetical protein
MHTTRFDKHRSSSSFPKIADEIAVLPSVSSIFRLCPRLCAHVSVTCISILYYYFVYDMCWRFLWHICICTYPMVMGSSSCCGLCSCYECLLSWAGSDLYKVCVCCYLVFNSCNVSNIELYMSIYASSCVVCF